MTNNRFIHSERHGSFVYFHGRPKVNKASFSRRRVRQLNWWLNRILRRKHKIRKIDVIMEYEESEYRFMIRETPDICTGKQKNELVVLRPQRTELRTINHLDEWQTEAYRVLFGKILYGDREYFSDLEIFTLEPLLKDGENALQCRNIPGMDEVLLVQCKFRSTSGEILALHGPDVIGMIGDLKRSLLAGSEIVSAKFRFRINALKNVQTLKIKLGNRAEFPYCCEKIIEAWLTERGFKYGSK